MPRRNEFDVLGDNEPQVTRSNPVQTPGLRELHGALMPKAVQDRMGQLVGGIVDFVTAAPTAEGAEALVPTGAREMLELGNIASDALGGPTLDEERNRELIQDRYRATEELFNIDPPNNPIDIALRNLGPALIPLGQLPAATSRGGKIAEGAARVLVPFNQSRTAAGFSAEAGLSAALPIGIMEYANSEGGLPPGSYQGFTDNPLEEGMAAQAGTSGAAPEEGSPGEGLPNGDNVPQLLPPENEFDVISEERQLQYERERQASVQENARTKLALTGLAVIGGGIGLRALMNARTKSTPPLDEITFGEELGFRGRGPDSGLRKFAEKRMPLTRDYDEFSSKLGAGGDFAAQRQRAQGFKRTGQFPENMFDELGETVKSPVPPRDTFINIDSSPKRELINELIDLRDELDQRRYAVLSGRSTVGEPSTRFADMTTQDMMKRVRQLETDPDVLKNARDYWSISRSILDYAKSKKWIGADEYNDLLSAHPHFRPRISPGQSGSLLRRFFGMDNVSVTDDASLFDRRAINSTVDEDALASPVDALDRYIEETFRRGDFNEIASQFFRGMNREQQVFKRYTKQAPKGKPSVRVREMNSDGTRMIDAYYEVNDPLLRHVLQFNPEQAGNVLDMSRRLSQQMATGLGNPGFAPTGFLYDAATIPFTLAKGQGRRIGLLPANIAENIPDITAFPFQVAGVGRAWWGQAVAGAERIARNRLAQNKAFPAMFGGEEGTRKFANWAARAYANSTLHAAERVSAINTRFLDDASTQARLGRKYRQWDAANSNPGEGTTKTLFNAYKATLDGIQQGPRLAFFHRNYRPGMSPTELAKLADETSRVTGKFTTRGVGAIPGNFKRTRVANIEERGIGGYLADAAKDTTAAVTGVGARSIARFVPYGNVTIESVSRLAEMMKSNPQLVATGVFASFAPWLRTQFIAQELGPEYVNHYWNELTWQDRLTDYYIYEPGEPPENAHRVPIWPEMSLFMGPMMAMSDAMIGLSNGEYDNANKGYNDYLKRIFEAAAASGSRVGTVGVPPAVEALMATQDLSVRTDIGKLAEGGSPITLNEIYTGVDTEDDFFADALYDKRFKTMMDAQFSVASDMIFETARAMNRDFIREDGTWGTAVDTGTSELGFQTTEELPLLGSMLWERAGEIPSFNQVADKVNRKKDRLEDISAQIEDIQTRGVTSRSRPMPTGLETPQIDPTMQQIGLEVKNFAQSEPFRTLNSEISNLWEQLHATDKRTDLQPSMRPTVKNSIVRKLNDRRERLLELITNFEDNVTRRYGTRFDLEDFEVQG